MTDHKDDFSVAALERLSKTAPHQALAAQCLRERQRCMELDVELNTSRIHWGELMRILKVPDGGNALGVAEEVMARLENGGLVQELADAAAGLPAGGAASAVPVPAAVHGAVIDEEHVDGDSVAEVVRNAALKAPCGPVEPGVPDANRGSSVGPKAPGGAPGPRGA